MRVKAGADGIKCKKMQENGVNEALRQLEGSARKCKKAE